MSLMQTGVILSARTVIKRRTISREIGEKDEMEQKKGDLTKKGVVHQQYCVVLCMYLLDEQSD
jgi:hypothetical protein